MNKKILISFLLVLLVALSASAVSAADDVDDIVSSDLDDTIIAEDGDETGNPSTWTVDGDDTSSIQSVIENESTKDGDIVDLGTDKVYTITGTVSISKAITLKGTNVVLNGNGSGNGLVNPSANGVIIQGLIFNNTGADLRYTGYDTLSGWGLYLRGVQNCLVDNCTFYNWNHGVRVQGSSNNNTIQNCYFNGTAVAITNTGSGESGTKAIGIMGSKFTKVINNTFEGPVLDGVSIASTSGNTTIANNTFKGNAYAIYFGGSSTAGSIIENNTFDNCGWFNGDKYNATAVQTGVDGRNRPVYEITVNDNVVGQVSFEGLPVISVQKSSDNFEISNNIFKVRTGSVIIGAEEANTAHGYPSDIGTILVKDNTVEGLNDSVVMSSVTLLRIVSVNGTLNPTGGIDVVNNTLNGAKAVTYWSNDWGNNEGDVSIPGAEPVVTVIEIKSIGSNALVGVLKDINGDTKSGETIYYTMNGANATVETDSDGSFTIANPSGSIELSFAGDSTLAASNASVSFTNPAASKITVSTLNVLAGDNGKLQLTLKDDSGKAVANKTISVFINGKLYSATTSENGIATVSVKFASAATYYATASFAGDDNYKSSIANGKIVVSKKSTALTAAKKTFKVKATKKVAITLKSSGKAVASKTVSIKVNGKTFSAKTNSKGVATITVKLTKKGTYTYKASFAGDGIYKASSKSAKIVVK